MVRNLKEVCDLMELAFEHSLASRAIVRTIHRVANVKNNGHCINYGSFGPGNDISANYRVEKYIEVILATISRVRIRRHSARSRQFDT